MNFFVLFYLFIYYNPLNHLHLDIEIDFNYILIVSFKIIQFYSKVETDISMFQCLHTFHFLYPMPFLLYVFVYIISYDEIVFFSKSMLFMYTNQPTKKELIILIDVRYCIN